MNRPQQRLIYTLKRQFGRKVYYYDFNSRTSSRTTGEAYMDYTMYPITKGIILSAMESRRFAYDLAFIAAAKNFTMGGFFDSSLRLVIIDRKELPVNFEASLSDRLSFDGRRYEVTEFEEFEGSYSFICRAVKNIQEYDPQFQTMIDNGWAGQAQEKVALDELARAIRTLFENDVPSTFFLWPCCGDTLTDATKSLFGAGITNTGFIAADYHSRGVNGGIEGDAVTKYAKSNYPFDATLDLANYHMSVMCEELDVASSEFLLSVADAAGVTIGMYVDSGNLIGTMGLVAETVNWLASQIKGHFLLSATANNSLKAYFDGVEEDENTTVRSTVIPTTREQYIGANNNNGTAAGFSKARIKTVTIGAGLTDAQALSLFTAINTFNTRLGRV